MIFHYVSGPLRAFQNRISKSWINTSKIYIFRPKLDWSCCQKFLWRHGYESEFNWVLFSLFGIYYVIKNATPFGSLPSQKGGGRNTHTHGFIWRAQNLNKYLIRGRLSFTFFFWHISIQPKCHPICEFTLPKGWREKRTHTHTHKHMVLNEELRTWIIIWIINIFGYNVFKSKIISFKILFSWLEILESQKFGGTKFCVAFVDL